MFSLIICFHKLWYIKINQYIDTLAIIQLLLYKLQLEFTVTYCT